MTALALAAGAVLERCRPGHAFCGSPRRLHLVGGRQTACLQPCRTADLTNRPSRQQPQSDIGIHRIGTASCRGDTARGHVCCTRLKVIWRGGDARRLWLSVAVGYFSFLTAAKKRDFQRQRRLREHRSLPTCQVEPLLLLLLTPPWPCIGKWCAGWQRLALDRSLN
jgi:hypothetical protein